MDKFEDVCTKKGMKRCCNGSNILADPIGKGLRVPTIPASGTANLVNQGLEGRFIGIGRVGVLRRDEVGVAGTAVVAGPEVQRGV